MIGSPNSPARWLSENIALIPADHPYALIRMYQGTPKLIASGLKSEMKLLLIDPTIEVICELSKYRFQLGPL